MRIRLPFAGVFFLLLLLAAYAGLTTIQVGTYVNDKALHATTFFALTLVFYWVIDTTRRRTLNLTLAVCTGGLGLGSELLQAVLPNGRDFDAYDVVANVVGSLAGLALCSWYHKRMLERKRLHKLYNAVPGEEPGEDEDLELGEGIGIGLGSSSGAAEDATAHEEGVITTEGPSAAGGAGVERTTTLEEEVDNWDENAVDAWDDNDVGDVGGTATTPGKGTGAASEQRADHAESKKRID